MSTDTRHFQFARIALAATAAFALTACLTEPEPFVDSIDPPAATIEVGETVNLGANAFNIARSRSPDPTA